MQQQQPQTLPQQTAQVQQVLVDEQVQVEGYPQNNRGRHRAGEHVRRQRQQRRQMNNISTLLAMIAIK
ncbi:hypothetical protein KPH14_001216 [Odynerus spinipes]|uniref:Uncharacterized protein n=1 Tax=Odynerus spinipes TaxID=1348599 RepID=A0AAD9RQB7_9HYME|nr:hypothetical protein KPH14_001216 [Odynerus spinipes]